MPQIIAIGCEGGGPETQAVCAAKVGLAQALERHVTSSHSAVIDRYALVMRIDGSLQRYGAEGLSRLRLSRARRYITVDIQVPESVWRPLAPPALREYIARQAAAAVEACVTRLEREGAVGREALQGELRSAIAEYLAQPG